MNQQQSVSFVSIQQRLIIASKIGNPNIRERVMKKLREEAIKIGPKKA